jgi:hypothetical protein
MSRAHRRTVLGFALAAPLLATGGRVWAFPDVDEDSPWLAHGEESDLAPDHTPLARFLARYRTVGADGIARVRYGAVTGQHRADLRAYLDVLAAVPVSRLPRAVQQAFWINLYNGLTLDLVLAHYPVASIRDIGGGLFTVGPWGETVVVVEGRELSLDDIEHGILRPIWRDPRLHYALNCASLGCPDLAATPWSATTGEAMLEEAAWGYVNHPRGARFDARGQLVVSSIYRWYGEDFGGGEAGVLNHLRRHAGEPLAEGLARIDAIADDSYDWRLNDGSGLP